MISKILVTGGAAFLGSDLWVRLLARSDDVLCVDNFFTGNKANVVHPVAQPSVELMRHEIKFPLYVGVDRIFNLTCPASPIHYQHGPVQTTKASVHGAINMLGLAKRVKAGILQASTSEVYGDPEILHNRKATGVGSIRLVSAVAITRASAAPKPCLLITVASTSLKSR